MMHPALKPVAAWLFSLMMTAAPPGRPQYEAAAQESIAQTTERYTGISEAIAEVAFDPTEVPIGSRTFTAALLGALAYHESGFRRDVDLGIGRQRLAKTGWNDWGRSWCMMQLHLGVVSLPLDRSVELSKAKGWSITQDSHDRTSEGWTGLELLDDRVKCFSAGLHAVKKSINSCRSLPKQDWLRSYASGNCNDGAQASSMRMRTAIRWARKAPGTWRDADLLKAVMEQPNVSATVVAMQ